MEYLKHNIDDETYILIKNLKYENNEQIEELADLIIYLSKDNPLYFIFGRFNFFLSNERFKNYQERFYSYLQEAPLIKEKIIRKRFRIENGIGYTINNKKEAIINSWIAYEELSIYISNNIWCNVVQDIKLNGYILTSELENVLISRIYFRRSVDGDYILIHSSDINETQNQIDIFNSITK